MAQVFVTHRMTGVHPIPEEWLDGYAPSGFRYATARAVASWYDERDLPVPPAVVTAAQAEPPEVSTPGEVMGHRLSDLEPSPSGCKWYAGPPLAASRAQR
ncbi:MAG TPA: hypothetical protein VGW38_24000 [Chloroflexota bacterium]|nr:hypothetical protein [Chloroflexota bacterium]